MINELKECNWLKPAKGHVVVFVGKGKLISRKGLIVTEPVEKEDPDVRWGKVAAVAQEPRPPQEPGPDATVADWQRYSEQAALSLVARRSQFSVGDVVVFIGYDGVAAPSPVDGLEVLILPEESIITKVDVRALMDTAESIHRAAQAAQAAQAEAAERLAKARQEHVKAQQVE